MRVICHLLLNLGICAVCFFRGEGKEIIVPAEKIQVQLLVGTTTSFTGVSFDIILEKALPAEVGIDRVKFAANRSTLPKFEIRDDGDRFAFELDKNEIGAARQMIQMVDANPRQDLLQTLSNGRNYVFIDGPIRVDLDNGDVLIINSEALRQATLGDIVLTEEQNKLLVAKRGGAHTLYQNKIDFGIRGDTPDSMSRQFALSFSFFGVPLDEVPWWTFAVKGNVSTNKHDPVSELRLFPITVGQMFGLEKGKPLQTGEVRFLVGIEGEQSFKKKRLNGSLYYTTLLPNLVDLTFGKANRLRLFPVIKLGVEYWDELNDADLPGPLEKGGKFGGELYYYVPVIDHYSLLIEGNFGFPFGGGFKKKYNVDDFISRFDVTLGYEVNGADLKVLAKYSFGQNDISFVEDTRILIGVAVDFFNLVKAQN